MVSYHSSPSSLSSPISPFAHLSASPAHPAHPNAPPSSSEPSELTQPTHLPQLTQDAPLSLLDSFLPSRPGRRAGRASAARSVLTAGFSDSRMPHPLRHDDPLSVSLQGKMKGLSPPEVVAPVNPRKDFFVTFYGRNPTSLHTALSLLSL